MGENGRKKVNVEADANAIIDAATNDKTDKTLRAYRDAESFANAISRLLPALAAARTLAGTTDVYLGDDRLMLPLCVNTAVCAALESREVARIERIDPIERVERLTPAKIRGNAATDRRGAACWK